MGYVNENGEVVIEHMGGETLPSYEIYVAQSSEIKVYRYEGDPWEIGERCLPPVNATLFSEENMVKITVFTIYDDNNKQLVFDGILKGEGKPAEASPEMLVTTLRTNTTDEDLICYTNYINPEIDPVTYIYSWFVNTGGGYKPLANLLMPFDTQNSIRTKDYSGNDNDGTIDGAIWSSSGKLGGAYSFNGESYISIPYSFEGEYIDEITVESWVKTHNDSGTIVSFNRDEYWELAVSDGYVKWSTNASDGTVDVKGEVKINDNTWHHVAASYESSTGKCKIYVDGVLDYSSNAHAAGVSLGSGDPPENGYIGKGTGTASRETIFSTSFETLEEKDSWSEHNKTEGEVVWETLWYDNFEGGNWGNWNDGGGDCRMYNGGTYAYQGNSAVDIQDNSGASSTTYSNVIEADTAEYVQMMIDFWWIAVSMEPGEDFWVNYYDGTNTHRLATIVIGTGEYSNNVFYHTVCYVNETEYGAFTDAAQFKIQCDASSNYDDVYLDEIYINVSTEKRLDYDFDLRNSSELIPRTGTYSLGGSGDFDPESVAFNRTSIDISNYNNVTVKVWYSYKSTESDDEFGFYYKNGSSWVPIFEEPSPQVGDGNQHEWTFAEAQIPDSLDNLVLQFRWSTSSTTEYMAIDDLEITGVPKAGESNFTGMIDELKIYERVLSPEQIYQNFLCSRDGLSNVSVVVSEETTPDEHWKCKVTPNDGMRDDVGVESNVLKIICYGGGA
jgi:hypothetical protein